MTIPTVKARRTNPVCTVPEESSVDWVSNNLDTCLWFLEHRDRVATNEAKLKELRALLADTPIDMYGFFYNAQAFAHRVRLILERPDDKRTTPAGEPCDVCQRIYCDHTRATPEKSK